VQGHWRPREGRSARCLSRMALPLLLATFGLQGWLSGQANRPSSFWPSARPPGSPIFGLKGLLPYLRPESPASRIFGLKGRFPQGTRDARNPPALKGPFIFGSARAFFFYRVPESLLARLLAGSPRALACRRRFTSSFFLFTTHCSLFTRAVRSWLR
jgi:hypothetical protein